MKKSSKIFWGLALIAIGVILGGNATGLFSVDVFFEGWWTLFIIVPSIWSLITDFKESPIANTISLIIGVLLLLACQKVIEFDLVWKMIAPLILVGIGLSLVFGKKTCKKN